MSVNLYQIQYDKLSSPEAESGLLSFDCCSNPEYLKREMAHWIRFYREVVIYGNDDDYYALLSPKFSQKLEMPVIEVKNIIYNNPDRDIYLFNPYPMATYLYYNIWEHGEERHSGLITLSEELLRRAEVDYSITNSRNDIFSFAFCNYWVAKKSFLDKFIPFIELLDNTLEQMPNSLKKKYFEQTSYGSYACMYPFIFERMISLFLCYEKYSVYPYIKKDLYTNPIKKKISSFFNLNSMPECFYLWEKNASDESIRREIKKRHSYTYPYLRNSKGGLIRLVGELGETINLLKINSRKSICKP